MVNVVDKRGAEKPKPAPHHGPGMIPGFEELHYTAALGTALHYQGAIDYCLQLFKRDVAKWKIGEILRRARGLQEPPPENVVPMVPKYERNAPCHCGSGIKFKKCCWDKPVPEEREAE